MNAIFLFGRMTWQLIQIYAEIILPNVYITSNVRAKEGYSLSQVRSTLVLTIQEAM